MISQPLLRLSPGGHKAGSGNRGVGRSPQLTCQNPPATSETADLRKRKLNRKFDEIADSVIP